MSQSIQERLAALEAENAALKSKAAADSHIRFKVSEKGCLSMYGLGRFPVSLYVGQWERLIANIDGIQGALKQHAPYLKRKE